MALMTGLNNANLIYACIWCRVAKKERYPHKVTRGECVHTSCRMFTCFSWLYRWDTVYQRPSTTHHLLVASWEPTEKIYFLKAQTTPWQQKTHHVLQTCQLTCRTAAGTSTHFSFGLTFFVQSAKPCCQTERSTFFGLVLLACSALNVPWGTCGKNIQPDATVWVCCVPHQYAYEAKLN